MIKKYFETAGLCFSVTSDIELNFGTAESFFLSARKTEDISYLIKTDNFPELNEPTHTGQIYSVYEDADYFYRRYRNRNGDFIIQYSKRYPKQAILYGDEEQLKIQSKQLIQGYLSLEVPLVYNHSYILHSSLVKVNGFTVAFSGASGVGKSTQAELWKKFADAEILSGDRSCIRVGNNDVSAYGTFYLGSSDIINNGSGKLKAIIFLSQSPNNTLTKLSHTEAFVNIYSQALNNPWDKNFVELLVSLINSTVNNIPVYHLSCRPDESAVKLLYNELFR